MGEIKKKKAPSNKAEPQGAPKKISKISKTLLFVAVFFGLVGFLPSAFISGVFFKSGVIYIGIVTAFVLTVWMSMKTNEVLLPNNIFLYVLPVLPLAYIASMLVNPAKEVSFIGLGLEIGTVSFITVMTLLVYLVVTLLRKKKYILIFQSLLFLMAAVLFVIQLATILTPNILGLSKVLSSPALNFVGNLNDLGVIFGATLLLSIVRMEFSPWGKISKIISYLAALVSVFMLAFAGFASLWIVVGLFSLLLFIFLYVFNNKGKKSGQSKFSNFSLAIVIISAIFIIFGPSITKQVYSVFGINQSNISQQIISQSPPPVSDSLEVVSKSFKNNKLLGVGPNRFSTEWVKYKSDAVNAGFMWSVDYNYANSLFLTSVVTTGLVGVVAWLAVFALLVFMGFRYVLIRKKDGSVSYLTFSSFVLTVYLWATLFVHVPSLGVMALTFMSAGMFIVSLYVNGSLENKTYRLDSNPKMSFVTVLVMSMLMIGGVAFNYLVISKVYASSSYQKALSELSSNNFDEAKLYMKKAVSFGGSDLYHRGLSNIYLKELQVRAPELTDEPSEEKTAISDALAGKASEASQQAWLADKTNYQNHMSIGSVLRVFVSPEKEEIYLASKAAFEIAFELSPRNPNILLALANLEVVKGNQDLAVDYLAQALELKPNYTQARFMWAQVQVSQGDLDSAVGLLHDATLFSPFDAGLYFQLGLLRFETADFEGAGKDFERVIELIPNHANARFYLALSYAEVGLIDQALSHLQVVKRNNPSNELLDQTIKNLTEERSGVPATSLEDLEDLPIEEDLAEDDISTDEETSDEEDI
jgi:tetratricopeptide (TPR) repeat protein